MDQQDELDFWGDDRPTLSLPIIRRARRGDTGAIPVTPAAAPAATTPAPSAPLQFPSSVAGALFDDLGDPEDFDFTPPPRGVTGTYVPLRSPARRASAATLRRRRVGAGVGALALVVGAIAMSGGHGGAGPALSPLSAAERTPAGEVTTTTVPLDESAEPVAANDQAAAAAADVATGQGRSAGAAAAGAPVASRVNRRSNRSLARPVRPAANPASTRTVQRPSSTSSSAVANAARGSRPPVSVPPTTAAVRRAAVKACPYGRIRVRTGDSWRSMAGRARVSLVRLLRANGATVRTSLRAGATVCLPARASTPATTVPPTTAVTHRTTTTTPTPTTRPRPTTTTTVAPTTTVPRKRTYTQAEVQQIIRDVWPDDVENKAIAIAWRESNWNPNVRNYCCFGLFQIYWNVHKGWLIPLGVVSSDMLYDPRINATAALALYQRAGNSFAPWILNGVIP